MLACVFLSDCSKVGREFVLGLVWLMSSVRPSHHFPFRGPLAPAWELPAVYHVQGREEAGVWWRGGWMLAFVVCWRELAMPLASGVCHAHGSVVHVSPDGATVALVGCSFPTASP